MPRSATASGPGPACAPTGSSTIRSIRSAVRSCWKGPHAIREPQDLQHHVLLDLIERPYWARWLAAAGVPDLKPREVVLFDDIGVGLEAAAVGMGIAMGRSTILGDDLMNGRLVRPFKLDMPGRYGFHLVSPEAIAARPKIARLRAWLIEEGAAAT